MNKEHGIASAHKKAGDRSPGEAWRDAKDPFSAILDQIFYSVGSANYA
jgi:hypothetical protein